MKTPNPEINNIKGRADARFFAWKVKYLPIQTSIALKAENDNQQADTG